MKIEKQINKWVDTCSSLTTLSELKEIGKQADKEFIELQKGFDTLNNLLVLSNTNRAEAIQEIAELKSLLKDCTGMSGRMDRRIREQFGNKIVVNDKIEEDDYNG